MKIPFGECTYPKNSASAKKSSGGFAGKSVTPTVPTRPQCHVCLCELLSVGPFDQCDHVVDVFRIASERPWFDAKQFQLLRRRYHLARKMHLVIMSCVSIGDTNANKTQSRNSGKTPVANWKQDKKASVIFEMLPTLARAQALCRSGSIWALIDGRQNKTQKHIGDVQSKSRPVTCRHLPLENC